MLSPPLSFLFFPILLAAVLLFLLHSSKLRRRRHNLPPGPPGWPIVGNLFQVARSGKPFFKYVNEDLRPKYGPIFTLNMGSRILIVVSDANLAHEALIQKGALFATRPAENPTRAVFSCGKFTVNASDYGPVWRSLRRNMVQNMLASARIKEFRSLRRSVMDNLVDRLRVEAAENRGAVWVLRNVRFAVFEILLAMCFGFEMDKSTVERIDRVMKSVLLVLDPRIDDFLPVLSPFFRKQRNRVAEVRKEQLDTIVPVIERRRRALIDGLGIGSDGTKALSFSYLDTLFDLRVEGRTEAGPSDPELVSLVSEFLNGGTDTTATAVEWGMAQLIANSNVQEKLYREVTAIAGTGRTRRKVEEKDLERMPYLQAVVKELLRKHPPTYFALTHAVTEATTLGGYDIPSDASVEVYLPGIGDDPKIWVEPERFNPDRFGPDKEEEVDMTGVSGVKMMPFGVGRRICPGLGLAMVHLQLMIARMVQEFEWSVFPVGARGVDFEEKFEFTVVMKNTLRAVIKPRV
ncbi:Cytochrome P450 77A3 [Linum grandiflorum]